MTPKSLCFTRRVLERYFPVSIAHEYDVDLRGEVFRSQEGAGEKTRRSAGGDEGGGEENRTRQGGSPGESSSRH